MDMGVQVCIDLMSEPNTLQSGNFDCFLHHVDLAPHQQ